MPRKRPKPPKPPSASPVPPTESPNQSSAREIPTPPTAPRWLLVGSSVVSFLIGMGANVAGVAGIRRQPVLGNRPASCGDRHLATAVSCPVSASMEDHVERHRSGGCSRIVMGSYSPGLQKAANASTDGRGYCEKSGGSYATSDYAIAYTSGDWPRPRSRKGASDNTYR